MKIAYTMASKRGDTDLLLFGVAEQLVAAGLRPVGTVQINTERDPDLPCDMDVKILPEGPSLRISQSLGREAKGCRLDPAALENAVGLAERALEAGGDCLIVNKFGKHEAEGRGFRALIGEALARDIPVLVGLNALNEAAFMDFVGELAEEIAPDQDALLAWLRTSLAARWQDRREQEALVVA